MNKKSTRSSSPRASRKAKSPSRATATKSIRRSGAKSTKSKLTVSPRAKARKKTTAGSKRRLGLVAAAAPRGRRVLSRVKRQISNVIASR